MYAAVPNTLVPARFSKKESDAAISSEELAAELKLVNSSAQERRQYRMRKRKDAVEDDIEGQYMHKLALEEGYDRDKFAPTTKGSNLTKEKSEKPPQGEDVVSPEEFPESENPNVGECKDNDGIAEEPPEHETIVPDKKDTELEKASRTVFLANVPTSTITNKAAKKILMGHLASFIPTLPKSEVPHAIESLRFRSTAFADSSMPRKAAFIKQELMEATTRSTNAYAVYTTQVAARVAIKTLNGTMVLDRHLRVDSVAHPAKQDHRRCVFVGNLGFVDDPTNIDAAKNEESNSKSRNGKEHADIEEGLWRQFGKAGSVESVRVVRDKSTRVGKGFAYVQFWDANTVEKALLLNGKEFAPMLPRILRVTRAKGITRTKFARDAGARHADKKSGAHRDLKKAMHMPSMEAKSLAGRANKLLGSAGAAQISVRHARKMKVKKPTKNSNKRAEGFRKKVKQR